MAAATICFHFVNVYSIKCMLSWLLVVTVCSGWTNKFHNIILNSNQIYICQLRQSHCAEEIYTISEANNVTLWQRLNDLLPGNITERNQTSVLTVTPTIFLLFPPPLSYHGSYKTVSWGQVMYLVPVSTIPWNRMKKVG